ncbi:MAG: flagellar biosynthesis anti-sigma factor FlgM [Myxococcota bacterium]
MKIEAQRTNGTTVGADRAALSSPVDEANAPSAGGATRRGDSVELSAGASDLAESVGAIASDLEANRSAGPERLQRLQAQVQSGSYPQQLRALAEKLVSTGG